MSLNLARRWEPSFEIIDWVPRPRELPVRKPAEARPRVAVSAANALAPINDLDDDIPF